MTDQEKIDYFDLNLEEIFSETDTGLIEFIQESIGDEKVKEAIRNWPQSIKLKLVDKHFQSFSEKGDIDQTFVKSWNEFYEMYDGKMDDQHMLHITIDSRYAREIEGLGYLHQKDENSWHKPEIGEFKFDESRNLVIIHACPDREIFKVDIKSFLDDLSIDQKWVQEAVFTVM